MNLRIMTLRAIVYPIEILQNYRFLDLVTAMTNIYNY